VKKSLALFVLFSLIAVVLPAESPKAIKTVESVSVTVLAYFTVSDSLAGKIIERLVAGKPNRLNDLTLYVKSQEKDGKSYVVYIGAGTLLPNDYVLTVSHLCYSDDEELGDAVPQMWVIYNGGDHPVKASVVAITKKGVTPVSPDYAVLKVEEKMGKPGATLAAKQSQVGERVYFSGSVKGAAFFLRSCRSTTLQQFLTRDQNGALRLVFASDEPLLTVYPAGPGDSGGGIFNEAGELTGVMFAGMQISQEMYVFSLGLDSLHAFLKANKLEYLVEKK
jgi:hypothetical protein